jgi:hypothetical protein
VAEITIGFVLYLTVQATTRFVVSIYTGPILRSISSEVGQFAYLIALLSWISTIMRRDPVAAPLSSEAVARIEKPVAEDNIVTKERIFAAVGIRINKAEADDDAESVQQESAQTPA